ncbi:MAG: hypothetical protein JNK10_10375 [Cyclobacteriaceae bacterium]|nr:hypothetical protein [Cyclobacteriaceae bacterium]
MLKTGVLVIVGVLGTEAVVGQMKKQFSVENQENCQTVNLHLKAKTGNCVIRPGQTTELLNFYSNQELEDYAHTFSNEVRNAVCYVKLALENEGNSKVSKKISYQVLGRDDNDNMSSDKIWKLNLTDAKPYTLDLDYGLGNANVDLSGLAISRLKINTGSANVNVSYETGAENKVNMDTFYIKVDLGSLSVKQINLSKSKLVVAEVSFGNMLLDFSDTPVVIPEVRGSVGAGNMIIVLPDESVPVKVNINESWLCSIKLSRSLRKTDENTYTNAAYSRNSKQALVFDLDVSMGKILFKEKSRY